MRKRLKMKGNGEDTRRRIKGKSVEEKRGQEEEVMLAEEKREVQKELRSGAGASGYKEGRKKK